MTARLSDGRRAMLLMAAFATFWAATEAVAASVLQHLSAYQVVWMRYGVHLLLMLAVFGWREPAVLVRTRRPVYQLVRSLLMLGMPAFWAMGMAAHFPSATLMAVFWLNPVLIVVLAYLVARERTHPAYLLAALAAFAGSFLVHEPTRLGAPWMLVFPLAMGLCFSLYVVMTRALRTEDVRANLFYTALGVFLALSPFMPGIWRAPTATELAQLVVVGVLGFFALYALDRMAGAAPVAKSATFAYLQVPLHLGFALVAGIGGGHSWRRTAVGLALIFGAMAFTWMAEPRVRGANARPAMGSQGAVDHATRP